MAKRLTREEILAVKDIKKEEVYISEWNGSVLVQSLSGKRRADIMDYAMSDKGKMDSHKLYPALIVAGCVEPTFQKQDADAILEKNSSALEKLAKVIMKLSGISTDDVEAAVKN
jgi:hypothetical protein